MTAQLKLSLIIGFGLVLVVAIIFADHLSPAADARMGIRDDAESGGLYAILGTSPADRVGAALGIDDVIPGEQVAGISLPSDATSSTQAEPGRGSGSGSGGDRSSSSAGNSADSDVNGLIRWNTPDYFHHDHTPAVRLDADGQVGDDRSAHDASPRRSGEPPALTMGEGLPVNDRRSLGLDALEVGPGGGDEGSRTSATRGSEAAVIVRIDWYSVKKGDTLYGIAEKFYGDGNLADELGAFNADRVPKDLMVRAGVRIRIPSKSDLLEAVKRASQQVEIVENTARKAEPERRAEAPTRRTPGSAESSNAYVEYVVRKHDSFSKIAKAMLGSERRWYELYKLNKSVVSDPDKLVVGTTIRVPRS